MEKVPEIRKRPRAADRVLALLKNRPIARTAPELTEILGIYRETIRAALQSLQKRGLVERVGSGHATRYRVAGVAPVAPAAPSLRGDRPRTLGFRAALLKGQKPLLPAGQTEPAEPEEATG